jgi:hypothetical protein
MSIIVLGTVGGLIAGGVAVAVRETRRVRRTRDLVRQIEPDHPLFCPTSYGNDFQVTEINGRKSGKQPFVMGIGPTEMIFRSVAYPDDAPLIIPVEDLRWFGRPKPYTISGKSYTWKHEVWFHAERDGRWLMIQLTHYVGHVRDMIRAIKQVVPAEMVTAYRRQRPYIHYGPTTAQPATQDMHGTWTLGDAASLYLMPLYLVVLDGASVKRKIPLEIIQKVAAIRRLDQPQAEGLVRFEAGGEPLAYALPEHEKFAKALAAAARRTLEDPVDWQRKKKKKDLLPGPGDEDDEPEE